MEADLTKLVSRLQRGADGDQELDLVQAKSLKDLLDLLDYHMKQHLHYRTELDNTAGRIQSLQSQITTLTAERDEARSELEDAQRQEIETIAADINHRKLIDEQKQKIDFLTAELAALKSCPSMAEVDACIFTPEPYHRGITTVYSETKYDGKKLADLARRSIASREEVVGLLEKSLRMSLSKIDVATVAEGEKSSLRLSDLSKEEANRIITILMAVVETEKEETPNAD